MARVVACSDCRPFTAGESEFEVPATTVRDLIRRLDERFPGLGEFVDSRMAVAIDGVIHHDDWLAPIGPDSEVFLFPKVGGG